MLCHNGSKHNDYAGPGMPNPHPFPGADSLTCTTCHGGNPTGADKDGSHVPPPPQIGDRQFQDNNATAYFNALTLTGIDKYPDYQVDGVTYSSMDYLQFVNPGDLRVTNLGKACGQCHAGHSSTVSRSPLASAMGMFSGATYAVGMDNYIIAHQSLCQNTAADLGFRDVVSLNFQPGVDDLGAVGSLLEYPVFSARNKPGLHNNQAYVSSALPGDLEADGSVRHDSNLAHLYHEQVAFTCGDCHLGSRGANNRTGDYRSSGCSACHMPYSVNGRYTGTDPNINRLEPLDVDDIDDPEQAHIRSHRIVSVHKTLPSGVTIQGIDDYTCAGCHQGSNRTVMQYWGIRLDQNQDLRRNVQYPANPVSYQNTSNDTRLFDPAWENQEFNGRNRNQYIAFEDYDGDGRDDTPADVHYDAGMGCIDCHGSIDLHGGNVNDPANVDIMSRMEHTVQVKCESCHGSVSAEAPTATGTAYDGSTQTMAVDSKGNVLRNVIKEGDGHFYLYSRVTGNRHFVSQTRDVTVNTGKRNPLTNALLYSAKASYSMGRDDGSSATGTGPHQTGAPANGFSHTDNMNCVSCHAAWTNSCVGCHLWGEYNGGNNFSNITGERIVFREDEAQFVYQSPVMFQLGVNSDDKITQTSPNTKMFFRYRDLNGDFSQIFTFSDRQGNGSNPNDVLPALSHNAMMAHSVRGKVSATNEGPRYCVACHLTTTGLATYGTEYNTFRAAMASNNFAALDYNLLRDHIGKNPGNQMNSPLWVHMVAGLGSGLFLFDEDGCAVNPLDTDNNRFGCNNVAPATTFGTEGFTNVKFNLDRVVNDSGQDQSSSNHALKSGQPSTLRTGAENLRMAGTLGSDLIDKLTDPSTGTILDSWIDPDGTLQGDAPTHVQ